MLVPQTDLMKDLTKGWMKVIMMGIAKDQLKEPMLVLNLDLMKEVTWVFEMVR